MITCIFIPGDVSGDAMAMVVGVREQAGLILPELVQWLAAATLDQPIGNVGANALREATAIVGTDLLMDARESTRIFVGYIPYH